MVLARRHAALHLSGVRERCAQTQATKDHAGGGRNEEGGGTVDCGNPVRRPKDPPAAPTPGPPSARGAGAKGAPGVGEGGEAACGGGGGGEAEAAGTAGQAARGAVSGGS